MFPNHAYLILVFFTKEVWFYYKYSKINYITYFAERDGDYTPGLYIVIFYAKDLEVEKSFRVPVTDDNIFENNENFTVTIASSSPSSVIISDSNQATITIIDDDRK